MLDKSAQPELTVTLIQWFSQIEAEIDAQPKLSADEKKDLKDKVVKSNGKVRLLEPGRLIISGRAEVLSSVPFAATF